MYHKHITQVNFIAWCHEECDVLNNLTTGAWSELVRGCQHWISICYWLLYYIIYWKWRKWSWCTKCWNGGFQYTIDFNLSSKQTDSIHNNQLTTGKWWCNTGKKNWEKLSRKKRHIGMYVFWGVTNQTWGRWGAWGASQRKHHSHSRQDPVQTASSSSWSERERDTHTECLLMVI